MPSLSYLSPKVATQESPIHGTGLFADYTTECNCGSATCRRVLTGKDWRKEELREKYRGFFSSYLQEKIDRER